MSLPEPHPGLVIRYSYLWKREHEQGREEGSKDRPCAIVVSVVDESTIAYGTLPPRFFAHVRDQFLERDQREKSVRVTRTE